MNPKIPKTHDFGAGDLVEVSYLEQVLGVTRRTAFRYLEALRIKPLYIGREAFFNLTTFKRLLFVLSKPGSPGFVFPSSSRKNSPRYKKDPDCLVQVSDEIIAQAADPSIMAEMAGCDGRDPSILKQFVTRPVGRPKEKQDEV